MFYYDPPSSGIKRSLIIEQADVFCQIGRFQLKQGDLKAAYAAYHEALRLHQDTATVTYPSCIATISGLADVAAYRGELTSATLLAENSLKILDTALVPTHPRISSALIDLSSLYVLTDKTDRIDELNSRLDTILQKPLGPWKEEFLETAEFYSGMLKKSGKTDAAARLNQLREQQKDRRDFRGQSTQ